MAGEHIPDQLFFAVKSLILDKDCISSHAIRQRLDPVVVDLLIWNVCVAAVVNIWSGILGEMLISALRRTRKRLSAGDEGAAKETRELLNKAADLITSAIEADQNSIEANQSHVEGAVDVVREILVASGRAESLASKQADQIATLVAGLFSQTPPE